MLTVDDYAEIRLAHRDGMSIRDIARTFRHSRDKVREALANAEPKPYTRKKPHPSPVCGAFHPLIDAILAEDESAPPKQRHTAMQVFRRLKKDHGYEGSYDPVRRHVQRHRRRHRETFIPLAHEPGRRLEADFGHVYVDLPEGRRQVPVLVTAWSYSNYPFAMAMPTERTEAILAGMAEAFAFFGCVPREVWWDNPRTVVSQILHGRQRVPNPRYAALASHYAFEPLFCMPARGNEKPYAETRVRVLQRQWSTPVPSAASLDAFNDHLRRCCLDERGRTVAGHGEAIGQRFQRDLAFARPLPARAFDACVIQAAGVDKYQTVRFDRNRYSVPRRLAFTDVTVKGYVGHVEVVAAGQVVARHARSYGRDEQVLDPLHYLESLGRRPAALDHAPVLREWRLPEPFTRLREALERRHGPPAGARHYVRVLQLLADHPVGRVQRAVEGCLRQEDPRAEWVQAEVLRLAGTAAGAGEAEGRQPCGTPLGQYSVPRPDLGRFDQLLGRGGDGDGDE